MEPGVTGDARFPVFVLASFVVFVLVLRVVLRRRAIRPKWSRILAAAVVVVAGGMVFARWGASSGLPWLLYYTIPALVTLVVPPALFRLKRAETVEYLVLAFFMAPTVHVAFSFLLGWKEYMPFLPVPSLVELLGGRV
jgi:hypothetical protein